MELRTLIEFDEVEWRVADGVELRALNGGLRRERC